MDHNARRAEIVWLRSRVAAGSHDITRIHLPLIGHCIEMGDTAEAINLSIIAADHFWVGGFPLKAFAVLNRALALEPNHPELTERYAAWKTAVHPDILAVVEPQRRPGGVVVPLWPLLEEEHRERITRCTIRVMGDPASFRVDLEHGGALPADWLQRMRYAVQIAGHPEPIPCIGRIEVAQVYRHELELTPVDAAAAAALRSLVRAHPVTGLSNIEALVIVTGTAPPYHVRNIYYTEPIRTVAEA